MERTRLGVLGYIKRSGAARKIQRFFRSRRAAYWSRGAVLALTDEQRKRISENKERALRKKYAKEISQINTDYLRDVALHTPITKYNTNVRRFKGRYSRFLFRENLERLKKIARLERENVEYFKNIKALKIAKRAFARGVLSNFARKARRMLYFRKKYTKEVVPKVSSATISSLLRGEKRVFFGNKLS